MVDEVAQEVMGAAEAEMEAETDVVEAKVASMTPAKTPHRSSRLAGRKRKIASASSSSPSANSPRTNAPRRS